ncbi:MAG TPA: divergent PAP2 family protein [Anaerolineales bacterium]|nr:divergent PAP2 family protein [Anaerolineales bacterium]
MNVLAVFQNKALMAGLIAWSLAQIIKLPLDYLLSRKWNWALLLTTGGMPSSHSSLMTATTLGIGLYHGFDDPVFAIAVAITMIVVYDAAGVRRQAGIHAQRINVLFAELLHGHMLNEKDLREVLGHTPLEVIGGILLGLIVATSQWLIWK